ncbi:MAG: hypothetical protein ACXVNF_08505 [Neobacillus sp.]
MCCYELPLPITNQGVRSMTDKKETNRADNNASEAVGTGVGAVAGAAVGPVGTVLVPLLEVKWATKWAKC